MEILIVAALIGLILIVALGKPVFLWLILLAAASILGYRAYRIRCVKCGQAPISGGGMKFCNQCGKEQTRRGIRFWCADCGKLTRSELNMNFCNRCGTEVTADY